MSENFYFTAQVLKQSSHTVYEPFKNNSYGKPTLNVGIATRVLLNLWKVLSVNIKCLFFITRVMSKRVILAVENHVFNHGIFNNLNCTNYIFLENHKFFFLFWGVQTLYHSYSTAWRTHIYQYKYCYCYTSFMLIDYITLFTISTSHLNVPCFFTIFFFSISIIE